MNKDENSYLDLCKKIIKDGNKRTNRTDTDTISLFGQHLEFDLKNNVLPLLTTKRVPVKMVIEELLWFLRGDTDSKILEEKGIGIWKGNTSSEFLAKRGLSHLKEGDIGAGYGFQFRHFGAEYIDCKTDYTGQGVDQLQNVIFLLKNDPFSRRIIINLWNAKDLDNMCLTPCHQQVQFYVEEKDGLLFLSSHLYQRSADMFLGVPFNIASYSILTHLIAKKVGMVANKLFISFGDSHVYVNHLDQMNTQFERTPESFPVVIVDPIVKDIPFEMITVNHFDIKGYSPQGVIKAKMAI